MKLEYRDHPRSGLFDALTAREEEVVVALVRAGAAACAETDPEAIALRVNVALGTLHLLADDAQRIAQRIAQSPWASDEEYWKGLVS